jgi:hypothetical protein
VSASGRSQPPDESGQCPQEQPPHEVRPFLALFIIVTAIAATMPETTAPVIIVPEFSKMNAVMTASARSQMIF